MIQPCPYQEEADRDGSTFLPADLDQDDATFPADLVQDDATFPSDLVQDDATLSDDSNDKDFKPRLSSRYSVKRRKKKVVPPVKRKVKK